MHRCLDSRPGNRAPTIKVGFKVVLFQTSHASDMFRFCSCLCLHASLAARARLCLPSSPRDGGILTSITVSFRALGRC